MSSSSTRQPNQGNSSRNPTFETVIDPAKGKIPIPTEFYLSWQLELHSKIQGSLCLPDKHAPITLYLDDDNSFMFYGNVVSTKFGLTKPTRVLLDYKFPSCKFDVTFLPDVETVQQNPEHEVIKIPSTANDSDKKTEVVEIDSSNHNESDAESDVLEMEDNSVRGYAYFQHYEPLTIYYEQYAYEVMEYWDEEVTVSMANLRREQVLNFPKGICGIIPGDVPTIRLISEDSNFEYDCKIHTSRTRSYDDNGEYHYQKHIADGWFQYKTIHKLKTRDIMHFALLGPPFKLKVKIQRRL